VILPTSARWSTDDDWINGKWKVEGREEEKWAKNRTFGPSKTTGCIRLWGCDCAQLVQVAGHAVRAVRLSFVGELGWELHVPNCSAVKVYEAVWQAGSKHGLVNAGYRAIDSLSIEKGCSIVSSFLRTSANQDVSK